MSKAKRARDDAPATFRAVAEPHAATALHDCVALPSGVLMPVVGFGTYKLPKESAQSLVRGALRAGYRSIETAYIYGGETTEPKVGAAIAAALEAGELRRGELFVTTKHWRKFHGYDPALKCLATSLRRLQLEHVDLWLMHWPGPAWSTMSRRKDMIEEHGPWHYAHEGHGQQAIATLRAETWRAMEAALAQGKARAIGVSNFSVAHLEALKRTAKVWPPAVNQVEAHPMYPQAELAEYCAREGIALQAYASLGGQDAGKKKWAELGGPLLAQPPVLAAAAAHGVSAAQVLLRWALQKRCLVIPKSSSAARMGENAALFHFALTTAEVAAIDALDRGDAGRLCWVNDPLRMLDFE